MVLDQRLRAHLCTLPATTTSREAALSSLGLLRQECVSEQLRLLAGLRLRGFLCVPDPEREDAVLLSVSHARDLRYLRVLRHATVTPLPEARAWGWRVHGAHGLSGLFSCELDNPKGLEAIGLDEYRGELGSNQYRNMQYGARALLHPLDVGVALLVRALPLVGVGTRESCDGHAQSPARVELLTVWDTAWLGVLLESMLARIFADPSAHRCTWTIGGGTLTLTPRSDHSGAQVLHDALAVSEALLLPQVHSTLRAARAVALQDFDPAAPPSHTEWAALCHAALRSAPLPHIPPLQPLRAAQPRPLARSGCSDVTSPEQLSLSFTDGEPSE